MSLDTPCFQNNMHSSAGQNDKEESNIITLQLKVMAIRLSWLLEVNKINNCATRILLSFTNGGSTQILFSHWSSIKQVSMNSSTKPKILFSSYIEALHVLTRLHGVTVSAVIKKLQKKLFKYKDKHIKVWKQGTDEHLNGTLHLLHDTFGITISARWAQGESPCVLLSLPYPDLYTTYIISTGIWGKFKNQLAYSVVIWVWVKSNNDFDSKWIYIYIFPV